MSQTILEASLVGGLSMLPGISSETIESIVLIFALISISVDEAFLSLAMLE